MQMQAVGAQLLSRKTPQSQRLHQRAEARLPGGVSGNLKRFSPYPLYMTRGDGAYLFDVDGNRYVDYLLVYGSLLLGHGHPAILDAVRQQIAAAGTLVFGTPHRLEIELAEQLAELLPAMELIRFTNSGLEGTLLALRIARAATGRRLIGKFEGHYHGAYGQVLVSVRPPVESSGDPHRPQAVPDSLDVDPERLAQTVVLPFNDPAGTCALLDEYGDRMAAVILEPYQDGCIAAHPDFLATLRRETTRRGIVLVFDEVKTGFRLGPGGAQARYGITPDLTVLGKVLGGGFPIGAVGGRRELMELVVPRPGGTNRDHIFHSGTFNGHPLTMAAGLAVLRVLGDPQIYADLATRTEALRRGMESVLRGHGFPATAVSAGSILNLYLTDGPIRSYRDVQRADAQTRQALDLALLAQGVYVKPLNRFSLSVSHTEADISFTLEALDNACRLVRQAQG